MIRQLLAGAIDYAGLFPPASLEMRDAVRNHRAYLLGEDAWALGRFVVPAQRLEELAAAATELNGSGVTPEVPWRISALVSGNGAEDLEAIREFNARHTAAATGGWAGVVDTVEARAGTTEAIVELSLHHDPAIDMFVEVPPGDQSPALLAAIASHRMAAKIRAGGVLALQIPAPLDVARFIAECARLSLPFKATAGLHHPVRGEYPLTYAGDSERGTMFGFLNVLVAAAAARAGAGVPQLAHVLEERDPTAFGIGPDRAAWRGLQFGVDDVRATRARLALSFGSCSFEEPLADLRSLRLL